MNLKEVFGDGNYIRIEYVNGNSELIGADYLYQAIKAQLIEEIRIIDSDLKLIRLIDTTDPDVIAQASEALIDTTERNPYLNSRLAPKHQVSEE